MAFAGKENLAAFLCLAYFFKHCKVLHLHIFFAADLTGLKEILIKAFYGTPFLLALKIKRYA